MIAATLTPGAPRDARDKLERNVWIFLDLPTLAEHRELTQGYVEQVALVEAALMAVTAGIRATRLTAFDSLLPHLEAALEQAELERLFLSRQAPKLHDKSTDRDRS